MSPTITLALPEGMQQSLDWLMEASISVLNKGEETHLAAWAETVRESFNSEDVQERLIRDLDGAADNIDGPRATSGAGNGRPIPYAHLIEEFAAFSSRPTPALTDYSRVDHSLDLGGILLDSLEKLLQSHPFSAAIVSLIREVVGMAKSVGKRLRS